MSAYTKGISLYAITSNGCGRAGNCATTKVEFGGRSIQGMSGVR
jgi:hypothetical protein